jgi:Flp pilus assembly protein TadD
MLRGFRMYIPPQPVSRLPQGVTGCALGAFLLLIGCRTAAPAPSISSSAANPVSSPTHRPEPAATVGRTSPSSNEQREVQEAMRGLLYDSGYAEVNPALAPVVVPNPIPADAPQSEQRGKDLIVAGNFVSAIAAFTRSVIEDPSRAAAYDGLSRVLLRCGRAREAAAACRSALQREPQRVETRVRLACALQALGQFGDSAATWQEVLIRDPAHPTAHGQLAVLLYYNGDYPGAWTHVRAAEAAGQEYPRQIRALLTERMPEPP